jgi:hypothetical protein
MVEESAAASEGLRDQAHNLDTLISQFVLPGDASAKGEWVPGQPPDAPGRMGHQGRTVRRQGGLLAA